MLRINLLTRFLSILLVLSSTNAYSQFIDNDAGNEIPQDPEGIISINEQGENTLRFYKKFEDLSKKLTPEIENEFDLFILVNTADQSTYDNTDLVPAQRLRLFWRNDNQNTVFIRDTNGTIIDVSPDIPGYDRRQAIQIPLKDEKVVELPMFQMVSSGKPGDDGIFTFSGIFRVNHQKSRDVPFQKGMFNSLYIDHLYGSGRETGVAIHGTPASNIKRLGKRASHGCVRIDSKYSPALWNFVLDKNSFFSNKLIDFRREGKTAEILPNTRAGYKVLIMLFDGYSRQSI